MRSSLATRHWVMVSGALAAATCLAGASPAHAAEPSGPGTVEVRLDADRLDLSPRATREAVARAAIRRTARRLGVGAAGRLRYDGATAPDGDARALVFHQEIGGHRVLWSEVVVHFRRRTVRSIAATAPGLRGGFVPARRPIGASRATRLAAAALPGAISTARTQRVAFAGPPAGAPRRARDAYVVQVLARAPVVADRPDGGAESVCVVIDARTGRVLSRWRGTARSPGRLPRPRAGRPSATVATSHPDAILATFDLRDRDYDVDHFAGGHPYREHRMTRPFSADKLFDRTQVFDTPLGNEPDLTAPEAIRSHNLAVEASNILCGRLLHCGVHDHFERWDFWTRNTTGSFFDPNENDIVLDRSDTHNGSDIAHELGHGWVNDNAGDFANAGMAGEVSEGLADVTAYLIYGSALLAFDNAHADTFPPTSPPLRDLRNPAASGFTGHMDQYRCAADIHLNSTILGRAIVGLRDRAGFEVAQGAVRRVINLRYIDTSATFGTVHREVERAAGEKYGPEAKAAAHQAFLDVGIRTSTTDPCTSRR